MVVDTTGAKVIIKFYEENAKNSAKIINREITMDNYKECPSCFGLVTTYQPFNMQRNGFDRLKLISETVSIKQDSLLNTITSIYSQFIPLLDKSNDRMETEIMTNFKDYKKYDWFVDLFRGNPTEDLIEYFVLSEDYRKRVTSHNILAKRNHLALTKQYNLNAKYVIEEINKRLNSN